MHKRALIVDDELAACQLIERTLTSVGIDSVTVTKSDLAPDILRSDHFSVVFLDDQMPFPDGPELARQTRGSKFNRLTPIVLLSDDPRPEALSRGFEAGASFFLYKPIDKDRLVKLVRATQGAIDYGQRRTRRVSIQSKVQLRFRGQEIEAETVDVSMEGVLLRAAKCLPVGSSVEFSLQLQQAMPPITGVGSVVRLQEPDKMGIHLARLKPSESQRLQDFLLPLIP